MFFTFYNLIHGALLSGCRESQMTLIIACDSWGSLWDSLNIQALYFIRQKEIDILFLFLFIVEMFWVFLSHTCYWKWVFHAYFFLCWNHIRILQNICHERNVEFYKRPLLFIDLFISILETIYIVYLLSHTCWTAFASLEKNQLYQYGWYFSLFLMRLQAF